MSVIARDLEIETGMSLSIWANGRSHSDRKGIVSSADTTLGDGGFVGSQEPAFYPLALRPDPDVMLMCISCRLHGWS
jgi:hypothetical protein